MALASSNFLQVSLFKNPNLSPSLPSFPRSVSAKSVKALLPIEIGATRSTDLSVQSVVDPSVRHANLLFFTSSYNVHVTVDENEHEEALVRRFRREVSKAGVIQECKRRKYFENKQEEKKRKTREAAKRNRRRRSGPRFMSTTETNAPTKKGGDDAEDNWEMPEGGLPF